MTFRPRVLVLLSVLLLPALGASCAALPEMQPPTTDTVPAGADRVVGPAPELTKTPFPGDPVPAPPARPAPPASDGSFAVAFPGDVAPGSVRWGAAIGGNADPARHESVAGNQMGLRRTFFQWHQRTGSMVRTATVDLAAGRLPWVSVKPPSWAAVGSGTHDGEIDEMLRALDALNGPVWLTVHHEPEGGGGKNFPDDPGGAAAWRAMQERFRMRMDALGTDNIAFAPILMAWTFNPLSGRNPADWWVDGIWDFAGIDHYIDSESATTMWSSTWTVANSFYAGKGLKVAIGEWGNRGTDAAAAAEMNGFYQSALQSGSTPGTAQLIGLAYFDSNLNSPSGGWELFGQPLAQFRQLMGAPTSLRADQSG